MTLSDKELTAIEAELREMYEEQFEIEGINPESLFWDSEESMRVRFDVALEMYDFNEASVLDVGCGFGDLYSFLREHGVQPARYHGIDINSSAIEVAKDRYDDEEVCTFDEKNILREPYDDEFDIAVGFGTVFNKLNGISNEKYIRAFLQSCFESADATLINALSAYRQGDWGYEEGVYYYSPEKVFGYAQELTRNVRLRHDFDPIPQKEFNLLMLPDESDDDIGVVSISD